jgi:hypothetical protein
VVVIPGGGSRRGGPVPRRVTYPEGVSPRVARAKLPAVRVYDLRYAYASLLLAVSDTRLSPTSASSSGTRTRKRRSASTRSASRTRARRWVDVRDRLTGVVGAVVGAVGSKIGTQPRAMQGEGRTRTNRDSREAALQRLPQTFTHERARALAGRRDTGGVRHRVGSADVRPPAVPRVPGSIQALHERVNGGIRWNRRAVNVSTGYAREYVD